MSARSYINVQVPSEMKALAEKAAGSTSLASWARVVLAEHLGYTLTASTVNRRQKYANEAEKAAAKKAYATTRAAAIAAYMESNKDAIARLLADATAKAVAEVRAKAA